MANDEVAAVELIVLTVFWRRFLDPFERALAENPAVMPS